MDSVSESRRQALEAMPAGDLKRLIAALGLSSEGCVEKADLVALVASAEAKANRGPPTPSDANRGPPTPSEASAPAASAADAEMNAATLFGDDDEVEEVPAPSAAPSAAPAAADAAAAAGADADDEEASEAESDVYEVEKIVDEREAPDGSGKEFFIKWVGWGPKFNTWEPEEHILNDSILEEWQLKVNRKAERERARQAREDRKSAKQAAKAAKNSPAGPPTPSPAKPSSSQQTADDGTPAAPEAAPEAATYRSLGADAPAASPAAAGGDRRDASLLADFTGYWVTRYYNGDIATQAGISKDNFSHWLNNSNLPKTDKALGQWEAKLREWSTAAREKLAQGRTDELPKARAVAAVDAGGGRGRGGRGGKGGRGRGRGRGGGAKAKAKAEEEDDGQDDYDNANESEGDGDHRIEAVLKEMRQGGSRGCSSSGRRSSRGRTRGSRRRTSTPRWPKTSSGGASSPSTSQSWWSSLRTRRRPCSRRSTWRRCARWCPRARRRRARRRRRTRRTRKSRRKSRRR